jgi:L-seryl-tRNA(Ser) seleniumtransferase
MGANSSGMRGRNPDAPASDANGGHHKDHESHSGDQTSFGFAVWQLKEGEDKIIADRLVEIFSAAPKA